MSFDYSLTHPTDTFTRFFREPNLAMLAEFAAASLPTDDALTVAQVGPSSGEETWTLAAAFAAKGISFFIHAYDASPTQIAHARRAAYDVDEETLVRACEARGFPLDCLKYFLFGRRSKGVEPADVLRPDVAFVERNILQRPLPARGARIVLANNVLGHYGIEKRDVLFRAMIDGCQDQGIVVFNPDRWHNAWTVGLPDRFPVTPSPDVPAAFAASTLIVNHAAS